MEIDYNAVIPWVQITEEQFTTSEIYEVYVCSQ